MMWGIRAIEQLCYILVLAMIAWIDLRERRIPNRLLLMMAFIRAIFLGLSVCCAAEEIPVVLGGALEGFLVGAILCVLSALLFRRKIGAGDGKLLWTMIWCCGDEGYLSFLMCLLVILLTVLIFRFRAVTTRKVPLAPFALAAMLGSVILRSIY